MKDYLCTTLAANAVDKELKEESQEKFDVLMNFVTLPFVSSRFS